MGQKTEYQGMVLLTYAVNTDHNKLMSPTYLGILLKGNGIGNPTASPLL